MARVRDAVLPDVAISRSQLLNLFPDVGAPPPALAHRSVGGGGQEAEPLLRVVLGLSQASAQLAASLEPREHGATSPVSHIREAIAHLHASAEALAAACPRTARSPPPQRETPADPGGGVDRREDAVEHADG